METLTYSEIEQLFAQHKYAFFKGHLNLNIFAIRRKVHTNLFDDLLYVVYEDAGVKTVRSYPCTTEAGVTYLRKPLHPKGTAIIVPGQYRGAYTIGLHKGKPALQQRAPMNYYRDLNFDTKHDLSGKIYTENAATNIHRAGSFSNFVNTWSAGCVVLQASKHMDEILRICTESAKRYGANFTFTLFSAVEK